MPINRSGAAVGSTSITGHRSISSPTKAREQNTNPISSFLASPRFFGGFLSKSKVSEADALMSPTSTLDMKPNFPLDNNPFGFRRSMQQSPKTSGNKRPWETLNSNVIGLALIASPDETPAEKLLKPAARMVTLGSHLKVHIPPLQTPSLTPESPYSPSEFGIKTRKLNSPKHVNHTKHSPPVAPSRLSVTEMELSEDYTRVISHGPNPRTTHIFDNCIVQSYCGAAVGSSFPPAKTKRNCSSRTSDFFAESFLSYCFTCKRTLSHKKDIYIYRGEKAFCSQACRIEEMLKDGDDYPLMDDVEHDAHLTS